MLYFSRINIPPLLQDAYDLQSLRDGIKDLFYNMVVESKSFTVAGPLLP